MHPHPQQQAPETFEPSPPSTLPATALTSLNALAHGGASKRLFIPGEIPADFFTLIDDAFAHHQPATAQDSDLVKDSVLARWFLSRCQRAYINGEFEVYKQKPNITDWTNEDFHRLTLLDRYKTQAERALRRALLNVNAIRKDAVRMEIWQYNRDRIKAKFEEARQKHEAAEAERARKREFYEILKRPHSPIKNHGEDGIVIEQYIDIAIQDGEVIITDLCPTNEEVRDIIRNRDSYPEPPTKIARNFDFTNNVPEIYEFLYNDELFPKPQPDNCDTLLYMSFEEWQELAETEDHILATQPKPEVNEEASY